MPATSGKITVMIVDDSLVFRTVLRDALTADPEIDVVAQAVNGKLALPRIKHYRPDILVLDQEMPEMDGLAALEEARRLSPGTGVIMFSAHTVEGAKVTIRALELGALDFVTKPNAAHDGDAGSYIRRKLVPRIKELARGRPAADQRGKADGVPKPGLGGGHDACTIGISTGGPAALRDLLPRIPGSLRGPLFIVQHMPPLFTRQLADSLDAISDLRVVEGEDGMPTAPGTVYIAPGGLQMEVQRTQRATTLRVTDAPAEANCKPAVNVLFRSVAEAYGARALAVIMTGMGNDGYDGMLKLKAAGAGLLAQSEASCLVFGMPARPTREALVDDCLDIPELAARIAWLVGT